MDCCPTPLLEIEIIADVGKHVICYFCNKEWVE